MESGEEEGSNDDDDGDDGRVGGHALGRSGMDILRGV